MKIDGNKSAQINRLCETYGVQRMRLFGSAIDKSLHQAHDVDVVIRFDDREHAMDYFERFFGLKEGLEAVFSKPVDLLVVEAMRNGPLIQAIDSRCELLYGT